MTSVRSSRIGGQDRCSDIGDGLAESLVGQFVALPAAVRNGDDQAAVSEVGQMVGQSRSADGQRFGEVRGIGRSTPKRQQDPTADRISQCAPETRHRFEHIGRGQHSQTIQTPLTSDEPETARPVGATP